MSEQMSECNNNLASPTVSKTEPVNSYMSPEEFAAHSGLSQATVRRRIRDGSLPHVQPGGKGCRILIPVNALERMLDQTRLVDPDGQIPGTETIKQTQPSPEATTRLSGAKPNWRGAWRHGYAKEAKQ
ncbi:MAG: helix-turn-helix domain-containing protein [Phycisphaerae bacterium]